MNRLTVTAGTRTNDMDLCMAGARLLVPFWHDGTHPQYAGLDLIGEATLYYAPPEVKAAIREDWAVTVSGLSGTCQVCMQHRHM